MVVSYEQILTHHEPNMLPIGRGHKQCWWAIPQLIDDLRQQSIGAICHGTRVPDILRPYLRKRDECA